MITTQSIITLDVNDFSTPIEKANCPWAGRAPLPRIQEALNSILEIVSTSAKNEPRTVCGHTRNPKSRNRRKTS